MEIRLLKPPADPLFQTMTFPAYRHLLNVESAPKLLGEAGVPVVQPVALGAYLGSQPVGMALMVFPLVGDEGAELLSVYVVQEHRGKGWGKELVRAVETVAANAGVKTISAIWTEGSSGTGWWSVVSQKMGWEPPEKRTLSVLFSAEQALQFPWVDRFPVREGCSIVPFSSVTREELEALKESQAKNPWIAPDLVPWRYLDNGFEERTSVALRAPDGIMGWVINHAVNSAWLRFTCSYIRKDWGRRGRILPLFSESLHRMKDAGFTQATLVAPVRHPTMVRFVENHMAPWVERVRWTLGSTKKLQPEFQGLREAG